MSRPDPDTISRYFRKFSEVEISNEEEGFRGSWFAGTVIKSPDEKKRNTALVEYKTLTKDEAGKKPLREEVAVVNLRPPPPAEHRRSFKFSDQVDAYYNDGWWEGVVTKEIGDGRYEVFFKGTRDQIVFKPAKMRVHREWVYGKWVPPLESESEEVPLPSEPMPKREKIDHSLSSGSRIEESEPKPKQDRIDYNFGSGARVEVTSYEEGFEGAWFEAIVIIKTDKGKYLIEYESLKNDDETKPLREEVNGHLIRPCAPPIESIDRFEVLDKVDALYNDAWWEGVISKVLKADKYSVYFKNTGDEMKFKHWELRVHQEWINGKWVMVSKARNL